MSDNKPTDNHSISDHIAHEYALDLRDPMRWQMKIRLFLENCTIDDGERWMEGIRLIASMAGSVVRDSVHRRATSRCYVCGAPLRDGRPAGSAGYYDGDRKYIQVFCHDQSEFGELMTKVRRKEEERERAEAAADKAAQQALRDARSKANRELRG